MAAFKYCTKLIRPSWVAAEIPKEDLELEDLGSYIDPNSTNTIADELQAIIDSTTITDTTDSTVLDPEDNKQRNAERILVKRQELRRVAYVQQLIEDAKNAIKKVSSLQVDLDNYNLENVQDAINLLNGTETEVIDRLRAVLTEQLDSQTEINQYLKYVKNLL